MLPIVYSLKLFNIQNSQTFLAQDPKEKSGVCLGPRFTKIHLQLQTTDKGQKNMYIKCRVNNFCVPLLSLLSLSFPLPSSPTCLLTRPDFDEKNVAGWSFQRADLYSGLSFLEVPFWGNAEHLVCFWIGFSGGLESGHQILTSMLCRTESTQLEGFFFAKKKK